MTPAVAEIEKTLLKAARLPGAEAGAANLNIDVLLKVRSLGSDGRGVLEKMLASQDRKQKIVAAQVLGKLNDPNAVAALTRASADEDGYVAAVASNGLAFMDNEQAVQALRNLAESTKNKLIEINALFGLCRTQAPDGVKRVLAYLDSKDKTPAEQVVLACNVAMLGEAHVKPVVDRALELFAGHPAVHAVAVEFYRCEGSPDSLKRLADLESSGKQAAQEAAISNRPLRG